ncbi:hypothetical protein Ahy_B09g097681 [Arachis hypogaea]|uniref:Aminotransferase-like plant mobile domain-containing protein n=1 Tax=Arachis hypogaea TaxID=3818 RepID=A0A444XPL8_ARAHY|nr:hypothetical protein Ahy_B09g097681 [Arachis hypogaea]
MSIDLWFMHLNYEIGPEAVNFGPEAGKRQERTTGDGFAYNSESDSWKSQRVGKYTPFLVDTLTPTTGYSEIPQRPTLKSFILNNKGQRGEPVSDNEHIAFLLYWLSGVVFCARSIQVEVTYLPLVIMLAEGKRLCLGPGLTISHSRLDHSPYEGEEKNH